MKKLLLASVAALSVLSASAAHATERYSIRCAGQLFTVYGHHGYMFFRGEPKTNDEAKQLPRRWFHFRDDGSVLFQGHKCEYVKDLAIEPCGPEYSRPCTDEDARKSVEAIHAEDGNPKPQWSSDFRHCVATKNFADDDTVDVVVSGKTVALDLEEILELQKHIPLLKKCSAFWQCVADRDAGKVKHCYENDRRWR